MDNSADVKMPPQFYDQLGAYCDGTLSADEAIELSMVLVESARARQVYMAYMYHHAILEDEFTSLPDADELGGLCSVEDPRARRREARAPLPFWLALLAAAVGLLLGFLWWPRAVVDSETAEVASVDLGAVSIVGSFGVRWRDSIVREGTRLQLGDPVRIDSGVLHMTGHNAIEFVLEGPAELVFNSDMESTLEYGRLSVRVPPEMTNYTVQTPDASVVDLGTEFGVASGPIGTEVHVFDGRVSLAPTKNAELAREMHAGEAAIVRHGASEVVETLVSPRAFASQPAQIVLDIPFTGNGFVDGADQFWEVMPEFGSHWTPAIAANPGEGSLLSPTVRDSSISRWIRYRRGQLPDRKRFLFRTKFLLPPNAAGAVRFDIRHSADDLLDEVHLNGRRVWRETEEERQQPFANSDRFQELQLEEPVQPGENFLTFYVLNADTAFPDRNTSPMMFRAEVQAVFIREPIGFSLRTE